VIYSYNERGTRIRRCNGVLAAVRQRAEVRDCGDMQPQIVYGDADSLEGPSMSRLGPALAELAVLMIGVFLAVAAYSRKPLLLRIAALGMMRIDPDNPGTVARRVLFICGICLIVASAMLLFLERLRDLALI
jgi:hypothetical protein